MWRSPNWMSRFHKARRSCITTLWVDEEKGLDMVKPLWSVTRCLCSLPMGDAPERLRYCTVDLRDEWPNWRASEIHELLAPELPWEGTDLPITTSTMGAERHRVRELRDACVFVDDDMTYLFYWGW